MKCPKCGSETIRYEKSVNIDTCEECDIIVQFYLKRLDKVLEKFDKDVVYGLEDLYIDYYNKQFILKADGYDGIIISLDTVEHLIKDMEAQDD